LAPRPSGSHGRTGRGSPRDQKWAVAEAASMPLAQPVALAHQSGRPPSPARRFCCAALLADQNWWASGLRYRRSSNRASTGLYAENGEVRRRHHMRPRLADSAGRRSATNREQRCAALGAVALPAGTTVWQGHLPRVGDGDLFAADASALWVGLRCLWVPGARFNHGQAAYSGHWLSRGRCQSTPADLAAGASAGEACRCIGLLRGIVRQLS
jgi:hypothetical protein